MSSQKTLVIRNGTLIDGSGREASRNEAIVIEGNRIRSVGPLPPDIAIEDRRNVEVIDAGGQWIMPGLIDAHCHVSYGYPLIKGEGKGRGTTRPEFSTLKSGHPRPLDRQALQYRRRDGHRGAAARQARRQFHQDG